MFLNASTPEGLRAAVEASANPLVDQLIAEMPDIETIAPLTQNRGLAKTFHDKDGLGYLSYVLGHTDIEDTLGPEPVIRLALGGTTVHDREEGLKVVPTSLLTECSKCQTQVSSMATTAFLLNLGFAVGRVDLCPPCAVYAIDDLGATPHIGLSDPSDGTRTVM